MTKAEKKYFGLGMAFYIAITSLYQDFIGKEKYINLCQNEWIDGIITVPIALGILIFIFCSVLLDIKNRD